MKYIYFSTPLKASIIDWDGISPEPYHIARFPAQGSDFSDRYILHEGNLIDKYLGMSDTQAMIVDLDSKKFPQPPNMSAPNPNLITPITLKLRFTALERVGIYSCNDEIVRDFLRIIDDPRLSLIDKSLDSTQEIFSHLVNLGLISESRKIEILK